MKIYSKNNTTWLTKHSLHALLYVLNTEEREIFQLYSQSYLKNRVEVENILRKEINNKHTSDKLTSNENNI